MEITKISVQEKNKDRCNVFVDGEYRFSLSMETCLKFRIKNGFILTEELIREMTLDSDKVTAISLGLKYVSKALKTKKQVYTYLKDKGLSENAIYEAIEKLKEYGYISDREYAKRYIESTSKTQGRKLLTYKLMAKGVSKDNIDLAYENSTVLANENARNLAEKRLKSKELTKENLLKTYRYLLSKGFSYEEAEYGIAEFKEEINGKNIDG